MNFFLLNILLAFMWMLFWGWIDVYSFLAGFALGYLVLGLVSRAINRKRNYATAGWDLLKFALYFAHAVVVSNLQVAWVVLSPRPRIAPRIVRYPVGDLSDIQLTTLANAITLTPGTLSTDVSDDGQWLYIHGMFGQDRDETVRALDEMRDKILTLIFAR